MGLVGICSRQQVFQMKRNFIPWSRRLPHLLPLAGSPRLIVLGREVQLGNGSADLVAIEPTGRIAIIEVKLARNAKARRAVIAQVLAYAAYLWKLDQPTLEQDVLDQHLRKRGYKSLAHAVESNDQEGSFDADAFSAGVAENLAQGHFRLVFVLDEATEEDVVGELDVPARRLPHPAPRAR